MLRSVIVPRVETLGDALGEPAEVSAHALADRFQGVEAGRPRIGVDAKVFGGTMMHRDEHGCLPSPVNVFVRSVPRMASTVSGMIVPS